MIVVELSGGLGNQLFQYAIGRNLSLKNNTVLKLDLDFLLNQKKLEEKEVSSRRFALSLFNIKAEIANKEEKERILTKPIPWKVRLYYGGFSGDIPYFLQREIFEQNYFQYDKNILKVPKNCIIRGYWQNERYFKKIRSTLKEDFQFKLPLAESANDLQRKIKSVNSVCLHVRRGDMANNKRIREVHGCMDLTYYDKAIGFIEKAVHNPVFFIFSDDIDWCKHKLKLNYDHYFAEYKSKNEIEKMRSDFGLMQNCKNFIIPNSTFAWWAAWLCTYPDKIVVGPKRWMKTDQWDYSNLLPKEWIRL